MTDASQTVGAITSLWCYAVKSMGGEDLSSAYLAEGGLLGDRAHALVDPTNGRIVSAKNPRKWPGLLHFTSRFTEPPQPGRALPPVRIGLPDGTALTSDRPDIDDLLSAALGRRVSLRTAAPATPVLEQFWPGEADSGTVTEEATLAGTFFDLAPLHLLSTATLGRLRELYPDGQFDLRRFRPNLMVRAGTTQEEFPEQAWVGQTLLVGASVRLRVTAPCSRCVMTTLEQGELPQDAGILKTVAVAGQGCAGVYAVVVQPGWVVPGDAVRLDVRS